MTNEMKEWLGGATLVALDKGIEIGMGLPKGVPTVREGTKKEIVHRIVASVEAAQHEENQND